MLRSCLHDSRDKERFASMKYSSTLDQGPIIAEVLCRAHETRAETIRTAPRAFGFGKHGLSNHIVEETDIIAFAEFAWVTCQARSSRGILFALRPTMKTQYVLCKGRLNLAPRQPNEPICIVNDSRIC